MKKKGIHFIDDRRQLRAIKSAVRQEVLDTILAMGGRCSITELAAELGRPADGLYYHVKALHKAGLLEEAGQQPARRGNETVYRVPANARQMQIRYQPEDHKNATDVIDIANNLLRMTARDFKAGYTPERAVVSGKYRNLWAARNKGWLSKEELAEANALLSRLMDLFNQPRSPERDKLYALTTVFAPLEVRDARRNSSDT